MKNLILSLSAILVFSACTVPFMQEQNPLAILKTTSGFSEEDEEMWAEKAEDQQEALDEKTEWTVDDVAELARSYEYSGHLGKSILLYEDFEARQLAEGKENIGYAVTRNIAVAYERIGNMEKAVEYYTKHVAEFSDKSSIKKLIEIFTKTGDTKSATYYEDLLNKAADPMQVEFK